MSGEMVDYELYSGIVASAYTA